MAAVERQRSLWASERPMRADGSGWKEASGEPGSVNPEAGENGGGGAERRNVQRFQLRCSVPGMPAAGRIGIRITWNLFLLALGMRRRRAAAYQALRGTRSSLLRRNPLLIDNCRSLARGGQSYVGRRYQTPNTQQCRPVRTRFSGTATGIAQPPPYAQRHNCAEIPRTHPRAPCARDRSVRPSYPPPGAPSADRAS